MKYFDLKTNHATYYNCYFQIGEYIANKKTALRIANKMGAIAGITVCIPRVPIDKGMTILDINNCPWALDFMTDNGFATKTRVNVESGYCVYPVVRLNMEKIREYGEEL
nr:MAG TPA: protein of unknown function (DUF4313) [Caudoviricetes sp.]